MTASVTMGEDAAWTVTVVNNDAAPLTGVAVLLHARGNGTTPLPFDTARMPGCAAGAGNAAACTLPNIPAGAGTQFTAYARSAGLGSGSTITGDATVSAAGVANGIGALGSVAILGCGTGCVTAVGAPGDAVASRTGPPTLANPTKQIVTLPAGQPGAVPIAITVKSVNPARASPSSTRISAPSPARTSARARSRSSPGTSRST